MKNLILALTCVAGIFTSCQKGVELSNRPLPDDAIKGIFSVSDTKTVCFSKGNLIATIDESGNPTGWKFASKQYDFIGTKGVNSYIGSRAGDMDLFGWSSLSGDKAWGINSSTEDTKYIGYFDEWGDVIDKKGIWRTLSLEEWLYLFSESDKRNGKFKCGVTVCDVANCLVLAPDDFEGTIQKSYNLSAWDKAEMAGFVCLPPAGIRYGGRLQSDSERGGFYWSLSEDSSYNAYLIGFDSVGVGKRDLRRYYGCSVRLVTDYR